MTVVICQVSMYDEPMNLQELNETRKQSARDFWQACAEARAQGASWGWIADQAGERYPETILRGVRRHLAKVAPQPN